MYELACDFIKRGMIAYSQFQYNQFEWEKKDYKAVKHQFFVGTGYFDAVAEAINGEGFTTSKGLSGSKFRTAA
jgi:isocitrate lyase